MPGDAETQDTYGSIDDIFPVVATNNEFSSSLVSHYIPTDTGISPDYNLFTGAINKEDNSYHDTYGSCITSSFSQTSLIADHTLNGSLVLFMKQPSFGDHNTYVQDMIWKTDAFKIINSDATEGVNLIDDIGVSTGGKPREDVDADCISLVQKFNALSYASADEFKASMLANFKFPLTIEKQDDGGNVESSIKVNLNTTYDDAVNGINALKQQLTDLGFVFPTGTLSDLSALHISTTP